MKLAIIGGGAAGMMAAAVAHETNPQAEIFVLEKNDGLGKKVMLTGGGRCNLTTGIQDVPTVLSKYPRGGKFLSKGMYRFSPGACRAWFEARGVPLKMEADFRVFPVSDSGKDIVSVFEKIFRGPRFHVRLESQATEVRKTEKGFAVSFKDQAVPLLADKIILTTGGQAYRQTGSTGDGYAFAQTLGHTITQLAPSLSSFTVAEKWIAGLAGVAFRKAVLTVIPDKRHANSKADPRLPSGICEIEGPFLFTHRGISGPAVFALSSLVAFAEISVQQPLTVSLDLFPDRKTDELADDILFHLKKYPKKSLGNVLGALVPKSFSAMFCSRLAYDPSLPAGECGKRCAEAFAAGLKDFRLQAVGRGAGDEFVTAGGVDLKEVNPSTMESKICPGLYLAGEILDVDGFTGGFNLQSAWATGYLAGSSAVSL